jgi:chorismate mutase
MTKMCRGVRGATTADANTREDILTASIQLMALLIRLNDIDPEDVSSAIFTVTRDLDAEFPALAARQLGWSDVPLLCSYEIDVPGSLNRCIRVLVNWNTEKSQKEIVHAYIKQAKKLRPDLRNLPPIDFAELEAWIAAYMVSHEVEVKSAARIVEDPPSE